MAKLPPDHDPNVIGVCIECHSDQPAQYLYGNPLGGKAPCKYCGGVIMIVNRQDRDNALKSSDQKRGI